MPFLFFYVIQYLVLLAFSHLYSHFGAVLSRCRSLKVRASGWEVELLGVLGIKWSSLSKHVTPWLKSSASCCLFVKTKSTCHCSHSDKFFFFGEKSQSLSLMKNLLFSQSLVFSRRQEEIDHPYRKLPLQFAVTEAPTCAKQLSSLRAPSATPARSCVLQAGTLAAKRGPCLCSEGR